MAVARWKPDVVELLLARRDIKVNHQDLNGRTVLAFAVTRGFEAIVHLLLAQPGVTVNMPDNEGLTPLMHTFVSARSHTVNIIKLLLQRNDLRTDQRDTRGRTALAYAAESNVAAAVDLLLIRSEAEIN